MAPPAAGTVVAEGVPGWAARREALRFDAPVVGWLAGDIEPDGTLHARVVAQAYDAPVTAGREIDHPALAPAPWPVRLGGGGRLTPVVAAEHTVPFPFCACGVLADYDLHRAHLDRFHDRLGYRMATIALVQIWGRIILASRGMRAESGRVIAFAVAADDVPERRRRAEHAAQRLGAEPVVLAPGAAADDAFAHLLPSGAARPRHRDYRRWSLSRKVRHWRAVPSERGDWDPRRMVEAYAPAPAGCPATPFAPIALFSVQPRSAWSAVAAVVARVLRQ